MPVMDRSKITLIEDLRENTRMDTMKVHVLRLWMYISKSNQLIYYEAILIEENGKRIQETINKNYFHNWQDKIYEGGAIFIRRSRLLQNTTRYKHVQCPFKLSIGECSGVWVCDDFSGSTHGFEFADFKDFGSPIIKNDTIIDVIGEVIKCYGLEQEESNGKLCKKYKLRLRDLSGNQINVTIWDEYAQ